MSTFQSDLFGAREKATALMTATNTLTQSVSVTKDTQTTVAGNQNAHQAIDLAKNTATGIAQAIVSASNNIKSVAEDFEAMDQQTRSLFTSPLGGIK